MTGVLVLTYPTQKLWILTELEKNCQKIFLSKIIWLNAFNNTNILVFTFVTRVPLPLLKMSYKKKP